MAVCQRCGTEYENEQIACPRCGYGKPKAAFHMPKWGWWSLLAGGAALLIGLVVGLQVADYFGKDWMEGVWLAPSFELSFNTEEGSFALTTEGVQLSGTYSVTADTFRLTAADGNLYVYRYDRLSKNRVKLLFSQNGNNTRITVNRSDDAADYQFFSEERLELPRFYLNTGQVEILSTEDYINATLSVKGASKKYNMEEQIVTVRGRGNSTWRYFAKKPYKLKFTKKIDLFGMGAAKEWVLLANAFDETMMRNYLAFSIAQELGVEYASEYQFVNLFLNDDYVGVYLLCEQTEEGENRVNLGNNIPAQVDTGYFIKTRDTDASDETARYFRLPDVNGLHLGDRGMFRFYIYSPDETECTDDQFYFIEDYVMRANEAIFTKDWQQIQELVDVDSAVKMFLVDQITLNNDMGYCFYLYKKPGGKLFFGPCWDYDQSCGGSAWGGTTHIGYETGSTHYWYNTLIEIPEFKALVAKEYKEHQGFMDSLTQLVDDTYDEHRYDFNMNNERWEELFGNHRKYRKLKELEELDTYEEHLTYLKDWLTNRLEWLEGDLEIK